MRPSPVPKTWYVKIDEDYHMIWRMFNFCLKKNPKERKGALEKIIDPMKALKS